MGWFTSAGIDLQILPYSSSSTDTLIHAGSAQFGISFASQAVAAAAAGTGNTSVMAILQHEATGIGYLASNTEISSPKDLDGKLYAEAGPTDAFQKMTKDAIKHDGGTGDFRTVTASTGAYEAVYKGKADFTGAFETWEAIQSKLLGTPLKVMKLQDYGIPDDYAVIVNANADWLKKNPTVAKAFVQALQKGYTYAAENPKAAGQILIDENPGIFDNDDLVFQSQALISSDFLKDSAGVVGAQTTPMWQDFADYMVANGLLTDANGKPVTAKIDPSTLFTNDYITQ
jgi:ABC-type nitrate/sulfonate/bicarbonate transport system substrate-binding protein